MKNIILLESLSLIACQPQANTAMLDDFVTVNKSLWLIDGNSKPYPFTAEYGHIACSLNEVYYFPNDTTNDESSNGIPLNKLAQVRLKQADITVPNAKIYLIPNADLSEAISIGLAHCQKVNDSLY